MRIDFKVKANFFDRAKVIQHFGKSGENTLKALSRAGAFVRTRARSLLRRRKRIASAGSPPSVHTSDTTVTLRNVQFAYDFSTQSVVVGPVLLNSARRSTLPVPQLLEFGGTVTRKGKTMRYAPHPWMGPALELERENLPRHWQASVRGAA